MQVQYTHTKEVKFTTYWLISYKSPNGGTVSQGKGSTVPSHIRSGRERASRVRRLELQSLIFLGSTPSGHLKRCLRKSKAGNLSSDPYLRNKDYFILLLYLICLILSSDPYLKNPDSGCGQDCHTAKCQDSNSKWLFFFITESHH